MQSLKGCAIWILVFISVSVLLTVAWVYSEKGDLPVRRLNAPTPPLLPHIEKNDCDAGVVDIEWITPEEVNEIIRVKANRSNYGR